MASIARSVNATVSSQYAASLFGRTGLSRCSSRWNQKLVITVVGD
jgi:hypothetical protein